MFKCQKWLEIFEIIFQVHKNIDLLFLALKTPYYVKYNLNDVIMRRFLIPFLKPKLKNRPFCLISKEKSLVALQVTMNSLSLSRYLRAEPVIP